MPQKEVTGKIIPVELQNTSVNRYRKENIGASTVAVTIYHIYHIIRRTKIMSNENPYGDLPQIQKSGLLAEQSRSITEVQAQVVLARQFPRNPIVATDKILKECQRITLAEKAIYSYPRGGTQITGPSIRLAEAIIRSWGNCLAGITEVDRTEKESSMLAYAWDLETNTMVRKEFKVAHIRDTKKGRKELTDERDIYEITANQGARRMRNCILSLIPGDVVDAAVVQCEKTLTANVGNVQNAVKNMLPAFEKFGVTKKMIEKRLQHRIEATQAAEVVSLRSVYNSLRDHMGAVEDYFDVEKAPEEVVKPAAKTAVKQPKTKDVHPKEDSGFSLETPLSVEEMIVKLEEYSRDETLPQTALREIQDALETDEQDPAKLDALLNKVKTAKK